MHIIRTINISLIALALLVTGSGYGNCFRCGSILLKDICTEIGIQPADYGGIFM